MMELRTAIDDILTLYLLAKSGPFRGSDVAETLRRDFPDAIRATIASRDTEFPEEYIVQGSPGRGQWNHCPWIAIFDPTVTTSAQRGYYPVYLFCEDMSGAYLSLNQGVTDVREQYKSNERHALETRSADYRSRLGDSLGIFAETRIDLRPVSRQHYSSFYEAGNIIAKFYSAKSLPDENELRSDLFKMLNIYDALIASVEDAHSTWVEPDVLDKTFIEDLTAFRYHRRVERNPELVKAVKKARGYVCEACGIDLSKVYLKIDNNRFIEAHHLVPIANLKGQRANRDPKRDFVVLCANCHRMIHRFHSPWDLSAFREAISPLFLELFTRVSSSPQSRLSRNHQTARSC